MEPTAQQRATQALKERRQAEGKRKVTFWAAPDVLEVLPSLRVKHGTADQAINTAVRRLADDE